MYRLKWALIFFVVVFAIAINAPDSMLARYGVDANILTIALSAMALTGVFMFRNVTLIFAMIVLVIGANLPEAVAQDYNINREWMLAALIALVIIPFVQGQIEG